MSIRKFFDKQVIVRRKKTLSGYKIGFEATATVDMGIQSISRESREKLGIGIDENTWIGYFGVDDFDISQGDQLTDEDGKIYKVTEIIPKTYEYGINQHKEAVLVEYND